MNGGFCSFVTDFSPEAKKGKQVAVQLLNYWKKSLFVQYQTAAWLTSISVAGSVNRHRKHTFCCEGKHADPFQIISYVYPLNQPSFKAITQIENPEGSGRQGGLACSGPWGHEESDTTKHTHIGSTGRTDLIFSVQLHQSHLSFISQCMFFVLG